MSTDEMNQTACDCTICGVEMLADDSDPEDVEYECPNCGNTERGRIDAETGDYVVVAR